MKTIGQLVVAARTASGLEPAKYAKKIKISTSMLSQLERDRPTMISENTKELLKKAGITIPTKQLEEHNYVALECAKAGKWNAEFRAELMAKRNQLQFVPLHMSPELQAASDAIDKELADKGTIDGIPVDTTKMVGTRKNTNRRIPKPAQPTTVQGVLPGFLDNVNARIEEMIVQLIFDRLSAKIDAKVDEVFGGKKHG